MTFATDFYHSAYLHLLSREAETETRNDISNWMSDAAALAEFLKRMLNSAEFRNRSIWAEKITSFTAWLTEWGKKLPAENRAVTMTSLFSVLVEFLREFTPAIELSDADGKVVGLAFRLELSQPILCLFNMGQASLRVLDGEVLLGQAPPLCCLFVALQQADDEPFMLTILGESNLGGRTNSAWNISVTLAEQQQEQSLTVDFESLLRGGGDQKLMLLMGALFGPSFKGTRTSAYVSPEGRNYFWEEFHNSGSQTRGTSTEGYMESDFLALINYYNKKYNLPAQLTLPLSKRQKDFIRRPALSFDSESLNEARFSGLIDCGFDEKRVAKYLLNAESRLEDSCQVLMANRFLGDAFLLDWFQNELVIARQPVSEISGVELNRIYAGLIDRDATPSQLVLQVVTEVVQAIARGEGILLIPDQWFRIVFDEEIISHNFILQLTTAKQSGGQVPTVGSLLLDIARNPSLRDARSVFAYCFNRAVEVECKRLGGRINIIGFFDSTGLGNNSHMFADAMTDLYQKFSHVNCFKKARLSFRAPNRVDGTNIICSNPNDIIRLYTEEVSEISPKGKNIGFFLWETSKAPDKFRTGADFVDEIWVPANFLKPVFESLCPGKPVRVIGKALTAGSSVPVNIRQRLEIPDSAKVFASIGEFGSSIERKNFLGAVQAFKAAVRDPAEAVLILKLKTIDINHWSNRNRHWERTIMEIIGDGRFRVLVERFSDKQYWGFLREIDAYLSLHRGEGFGYGIAHAMLLEKPVASISWSGEADFVTPETAFVIDHRLCPVDPWMMNCDSNIGEWAEPIIESGVAAIRAILDSHEVTAIRAEAGAALIADRYNRTRFTRSIANALA
ncbi:glycosyltransferase [Pseudochelatococcus lubricantis]|uniref:glycosyltransferase n=1 Tax=Pseudochelatococcus lubricantis TaxID=1538102 RepID=UPI0035EEF322